MSAGFSAFQTRTLSFGLVQLTEPLVYADPDYGVRIEVPAGFVCDGSSIPHPWGWLALPAGTTWPKIVRSGTCHDYLCRRDAFLFDYLDAQTVRARPVKNKAEADRLYGLMLVRGDHQPARAASVAGLAFKLAGRRYWQKLDIRANSDAWLAVNGHARSR